MRSKAQNFPKGYRGSKGRRPLALGEPAGRPLGEPAGRHTEQ
jgi:hypothetical protein